jgi:alkyldihydroxyacetonephosphate synthase
VTDDLTRTIARSVWHGWGDPAERHTLPSHAWAFLEREIGASPLASRDLPVALADVVLPEPALTASARAALEAVVGAPQVRDDHATRVEHAGGKSFPDLVRIRRGDGSHAPDVVVFPGSPEEVQRVVEVCSEHEIALVPFGGGTSVVGGVSALRGRFAAAVTLDLRRLTAVPAIDPVSRVATLQAGLRGPEVEAALRPHGLTLGHYPQSHQEATIGGYVATRSAGQASTGYGRVDEMVLGARLATPAGELRLDAHAPASAAGPRLLDLVVGSEGALGVITEATVRVTAYPNATARGAWAFPTMAAAVEALRELAQRHGDDTLPDVCRVSDPRETQVSLTLAGAIGGRLLSYLRRRGQTDPVLGIFLWEGDSRVRVEQRRLGFASVMRRHGAVRLPAAVAGAWQRGRFSGPYLRDELLDHRVLAETLETATTWERLVPTYERVRDALLAQFAAQGTPAVVQCHISHVYAVGASLYFTCVARALADPVEQWLRVKAAASDAIVSTGATITHHHAVGTDHLPWLTAEVGELGVEVLRSVKVTLDPVGVLNPGKLVPPA